MMPSVFSHSIERSRVIERQQPWRILGRRVLDHVVYEMSYCFVVLVSASMCAWREKILVRTATDTQSFSTAWDNVYFGFTLAFLLDLVLHALVFGKTLFKERPAYKFETVLQVLNLPLTIAYLSL